MWKVLGFLVMLCAYVVAGLLWFGLYVYVFPLIGFVWACLTVRLPR